MYKFDPKVIRVGISGCLVGQKVRFDGGHKRSDFCSEQLAEFVEFVPVCPEMAIGLGSPRPSIRLVNLGEDIIAQTAKGVDVTAALRDYGRNLATQFSGLSGYVLCAKSPSCGMERVRVYHESGKGNAKEGVGIYTQELMQAQPLLPLEEDGRLNDALLRENFVTRVFALHDWQCLCHEGITAAGLITFHSRYKYLLMAHHRESYLQLGKLLADLSVDVAAKADAYIKGLMQALSIIVTRKNHTNVLQHLQGYFKRMLNARQREELSDTITQYRQGILPLFAPITLLRHYLKEFPNEYLQQQVYLNPHPEALRLRYGI
ncbi:YbgA family protein [Oceanisphaera ostreae]|uniref:YbgA family protein n=1 Tax=Oceanisphaera ostreae TaxID=914151 RepID=A0ABW3KJF9_9GAMM